MLPAVTVADVFPARIVDAVRVFHLGGIDLVVGRPAPADVPILRIHGLWVAALQGVDLRAGLRVHGLADFLVSRHGASKRRGCGGEGERGDQREGGQSREHGASPSWFSCGMAIVRSSYYDRTMTPPGPGFAPPAHPSRREPAVTGACLSYSVKRQARVVAHLRVGRRSSTLTSAPGGANIVAAQGST